MIFSFGFQSDNIGVCVPTYIHVCIYVLYIHIYNTLSDLKDTIIQCI